jgi:hypothetical protein
VNDQVFMQQSIAHIHSEGANRVPLRHLQCDPAHHYGYSTRTTIYALGQNMDHSSRNLLPGSDEKGSRRLALAPMDLNMASPSNQHDHTANKQTTIKFIKSPSRESDVTNADIWDNTSQYIVSLRDIPNLNTIVPRDENTANTTMAEDKRAHIHRSSINITTTNSGGIVTSVSQGAYRTGDNNQPLPLAENKIDMIRRSSITSRTTDSGSIITSGSGSIANKTDGHNLALSPVDLLSEDIPGVANHDSDMIDEHKDKFSLAGVGLGKFTSPTSAIQNRFARFNSTNFPRPSKHRVPSWKADASSPEAKIDLGVKQILNFMRNFQDATNTFQSDQAFKLFIDANKEIVRAWGGLEEGLRKKPAGITLGEKVDCMHAILLRLNNEVAAGGGWVRGALEMRSVFS